MPTSWRCAQTCQVRAEAGATPCTHAAAQHSCGTATRACPDWDAALPVCKRLRGSAHEVANGGAGAPSFRELVGRVRSTVLSAVARSGLPFACVLDAVGVPAAPEHAPVFTTAVHLLDAEPAASHDALQSAGLSPAPLEARCAPYAEQQIPSPQCMRVLLQTMWLRRLLAVQRCLCSVFTGESHWCLQAPACASMLDLELTVAKGDGACLECSLRYNAQLYESSTAQRMLGHLMVRPRSAGLSPPVVRPC